MAKFKNVYNVELREPGEYYIGDVVLIQRDGWHYKKTAIIGGYDYIKDEYIIQWSKREKKSDFETCKPNEILSVKENITPLNKEKDIHPYMKELLK